MPRRQYLGGAVPTRLNVNINNSVTSFDINNVTKWPSGGANGPFNFTLDPGTPTEEHCTAASRTGNTLTGVLRAQDNTDPQPHNVGLDGTVRHGWFAQDADDANRHIYTVHDDHSGIYMRNDGTRHDVQARHQANTTIPVGVPSGLTVGGSNVEGISTSLPRLDHAHAVTRGTPVSVGTAIAAGASGQFADATHVHDISVAAQTAIAPTGAVWMWMTGAAPAGTILLQGQTVSRTGANAALFALWGTTFGAGDGSTTFGLPDFRQAAARFDTVFFAFWLSHVPASRFDQFWRQLRGLLAGQGRVLFVDEHPDVRGKEVYEAGSAEIVHRRLGDGSEYRLVKVFVHPGQLRARLRPLGWHSRIRRDGDDWVIGEARPAHGTGRTRGTSKIQ